MEFFINKNATLPVLKMQVVKDGRSDYHSFMNLIEKSGIFFSMVNVETGIPKITSKAAGFVSKMFDDPNTPTEYYIFYKFTKKDTQKTGRYEGQFILKNDEGDLIVPIREKLYINVNESFISDENCCSDESYLTPCPDCPQCPECPELPTQTPTSTQTETPTPTPTPTPSSTPTPTPPPTNDITYIPIPEGGLGYEAIITLTPTPNFTSTPTPTPTPTETLTPTPTPTETLTPTPTETPLPTYRYYNVNGYGCGSCNVVGQFTVFVPYNTPLTIGYFYNNPENRGYSFEILEEIFTPIAGYDLTGEPGYIDCVTSCYGPTPTPTITPTVTPSLVTLTLETIVKPGSLNVDYNLYSNIPAYETATISFVNTYGSSNGNIVITTGVTINIGEISGTTNVYLPDVDFNTLNGFVDFSGFTVDPSGFTQVQNITVEQVILDAILQSNINEYIEVGNDLYLKFVMPTPTPTIPLTPTPTPTYCVRNIVVPTLWNGGTSINSNTLQLTQTSDTLQIQVGDTITDNIGRTSVVGLVSSDGTYTYVYTGPGGSVAFDCQFPLTFTGPCV